jgi:hypothetical protein|tara:strand:+ start:149 stop:517 length:369 start_codon:yes stop_codon:yes gene_type:complete
MSEIKDIEVIKAQMRKVRELRNTPTKVRFFNLLNNPNMMPKVTALWDSDGQQITGIKDEKNFGDIVEGLSSGEADMAKFCSGIWNQNCRRHPFDIVAAMRNFDSTNRSIVAEWIANPFWVIN